MTVLDRLREPVRLADGLGADGTLDNKAPLEAPDIAPIVQLARGAI